jgi:hypothetical protein
MATLKPPEGCRWDDRFTRGAKPKLKRERESGRNDYRGQSQQHQCDSGGAVRITRQRPGLGLAEETIKAHLKTDTFV